MCSSTRRFLVSLPNYRIFITNRHQNRHDFVLSPCYNEVDLLDSQINIIETELVNKNKNFITIGIIPAFIIFNALILYNVNNYNSIYNND